ncbi:DUF1229 domain-containing protein [Leptospira levettii]|uniref:DUF1229 domain-containing protein n=1 Tax=Leptospira levettii TaxID=2023178 RepID=UPI000CB8350A|nr:DUF1229 domain-containing protein [Leptospira levettii]PJZ89451.1 hypothetical protein CH368_06720 [Leptospira levettii]
MDLNYLEYSLKSITLVCSFFAIGFQSSSIFQRNALISISLGMLCFALVTTLFTIVYLDPPYYGKAIHPIGKFEMNSPGTTILGSISAILSICFLSEKTNKNPSYIAMTLFLLICALFISFIFSARTLFFAFLILILIKSFTYRQAFGIGKNSNSALHFFLFLIFSLLLYFFLRELTLIRVLEKRIVNGDYLIKFQHSLDYFAQISEDFYIYPKADYKFTYHNWFHNFFYDVHRTSGPITALATYTLFVFSYGRALYNLKIGTYFGRELFELYSVFLIYLVTSIPWESGENQMIAFYSGFTAMILTDKRKV